MTSMAATLGLLLLYASLLAAVLQPVHALSGPTPPGAAPSKGGCFLDTASGPISYKFAPGDVFPVHHGLKLVNSSAGCCAVCQSFKNCSFWTYEATTTCYDMSGACCFLKTAAAWAGRTPSSEASTVSGSTKPLPVEHPYSVDVAVDWATTVLKTSTAATVEVDVMPFLGETSYGGPYDKYSAALSSLGTEFVRFSPWFANPRVTVLELTPNDCTASKPSTNWNSTFFDPVVHDFMAAVCGPGAAQGKCTQTVIQQLSSMPGWMYVGGVCPGASDSCLDPNPWKTHNPFDYYGQGGHQLVDETCGTMARYFARIVGWYTAGGFHDECGHWHPSGFKYNWWGLSVLNENEHQVVLPNHTHAGATYTVCFDAIRAEVAKVNPTVVLVGPEMVNDAASTEYFINASNHEPKFEPEVVSYHWYGGRQGNVTGEKWFTSWDDFFTSPGQVVQRAEAMIKATGQKTKMLLNEYITFIDDWCDLDSATPAGQPRATKCPNWQDPATAGGDPVLTHKKGVGANRQTWSWNSAAAGFAYGFGTLAELGYLAVGQDQLVGGTWPDNEPAVSCMDWQTGELNAKYWVTQMLAASVGTSEEKDVVKVTITDKGAAGKSNKNVFVLPYILKGKKAILVISKRQTPGTVVFAGVSGGTASVVEVALSGPQAKEPGWGGIVSKTVSAAGELKLGPYAVAIVVPQL